MEAVVPREIANENRKEFDRWSKTKPFVDLQPRAMQQGVVQRALVVDVMNESHVRKRVEAEAKVELLEGEPDVVLVVGDDRSARQPST